MLIAKGEESCQFSRHSTFNSVLELNTSNKHLREIYFLWHCY